MATENIHVSFDPVTVNLNVNIRILSEPAGPAASMRIVLGGFSMAGEINIDTANETAKLVFSDRAAEDVPVPEGAVITWTSDNPAVATVEADVTDATGATAKVTPVLAGDCNIVASVAGVTEPDGGSFPDAAVPLKVDPGAAAGDRVVLSV